MELKGENRNQFQMVRLESCVADEGLGPLLQDDCPFQKVKRSRLSRKFQAV